MSLALRHGWRSRPEATHPEVETLRGLAGVLARFAYFAYLWLLVFALLPLLWGWQPVVVTSASMSPSVRVGDVVVATRYEGQALGPGTVIIFKSRDRLVTHRISEARADGTYLTAGDANRGQDSSPVTADMIEGVGRILIPTVGLPVAWASNGDWYPMAWFGAVLVGLGVWGRARRGRRIRWQHRRTPSIAERLPNLERAPAPVPRRRPASHSSPPPAPGEQTGMEPEAAVGGSPHSSARIALHDLVE